MITPQQCLAGLFFLAAALALVGFLGLFFAMAHVRLVIPLARIAKVLRARVTALPNSRAALCLLFLFNCLLKRVSWRANRLQNRAFTPVRHGTGKEAVLVVCHNTRRQGNAGPCIPVATKAPCPHSCNFTQPRCDVTRLQRKQEMASRALAAYAELSTKRPYAVAFGSCAVKGVIADTISQRIVEGKQEQNWKRTAVFAFYGGWYCGWFQHALYNVGYARLFGLDTSLKNALRKVAFDSAIHVPLVCFPVYYAYKGALYDGIGVRGGLERYSNEWQMICSNYYMVWVPANLLVFTVVPVPLRIGFIACTSLGWLTVSSFLTHRH